jgi:hypothetical protein
MNTVSSISSIALIAAGIIVCLFGYRLVRFTLGAAGFGVGFAVGNILGLVRPGTSPVVTVVIAVLLGVFGAIAAVVLYKPGLFLLGAGVGALIAGIIFVYAEWQYLLLACAIVGVAGGVLMLIFQRQLFSVLSAVAGGLGIVYGALRLVGWYPLPAGTRNATLTYGAMALCWGALSVIGILAQSSSRARSTGRSHSIRGAGPLHRV